MLEQLNDADFQKWGLKEGVISNEEKKERFKTSLLKVLLALILSR